MSLPESPAPGRPEEPIAPQANSAPDNSCAVAELALRKARRLFFWAALSATPLVTFLALVLREVPPSENVSKLLLALAVVPTAISAILLVAAWAQLGNSRDAVLRHLSANGFFRWIVGPIFLCGGIVLCGLYVIGCIETGKVLNPKLLGLAAGLIYLGWRLARPRRQ